MKGGWFVAGTDTGVGKTTIAEALLAALGRRGERAVGMKPVASGCRRAADGLRSEDAERLVAASSISVDYADINTYSWEPAIAPHVAAAQAGVEMQLAPVEQQFARLAAQADWIVVEGAGGWYVPLNRRHTLAGLAKELALPVILVVGVRLGCINHALLSAKGIRADGLHLAGWVANQVDPVVEAASETVAALDERLKAPRLASIPFGTSVSWRDYGEAMVRRLLSNTP